MGRCFVPMMLPISGNATEAERAQAFFDYVRTCANVNPGSILPVGVRKRWWHFFVIEHPFTSKPDLLALVDQGVA